METEATFYDVSSHLDGPSRTGTYWFIPPGGYWDDADNGTYTWRSGLRGA